MNSRLKATVRAPKSAVLAHKYAYDMSRMYTRGKVKGHAVAVFPNRVERGRGNDLVIPVSMTLNYGYDAGPGRKGPHTAARGFVQAGEDYAERGGYGPELQKLVDKELKKYWG